MFFADYDDREHGLSPYRIQQQRQRAAAESRRRAEMERYYRAKEMEEQRRLKQQRLYLAEENRRRRLRREVKEEQRLRLQQQQQLQLTEERRKLQQLQLRLAEQEQEDAWARSRSKRTPKHTTGKDGAKEAIRTTRPEAQSPKGFALVDENFPLSAMPKVEEKVPVVERKKSTKKVNQRQRITVIVEDASDSEAECEFDSIWRNRRPSPGQWMEPVENFQDT